MDTVIFAAGKGKRLRPYTETVPKPLLPIQDEKKIIDYIIQALPQEIDRIIIVVDHLKEQIQSYIANHYPDKHIVFVEQGEVKGTFGALLSAKPEIHSERFLVLSGDDIVVSADLVKLLRENRAMGVHTKIMPAYYAIDTNDSGYFKCFRAQTGSEKREGTFIATGSYVLDTSIFELPPVAIADGEYGLPQMFIDNQDRFPIKIVPMDIWYPVNTLADWEHLKQSQI